MVDIISPYHGRSLYDSGRFHSLLLVKLGAGSLNFSYYMGHASLVTNEGGHVAWKRSIILGERPNAA